MPKPFKPTRTFKLPPEAEILEHNGKLHVRMKERGRAVLYPVTKDRLKYLRPTKAWYFELKDQHGILRRRKGFTDLKATEQLAFEMERKVSRLKSGFTDPEEEHARRLLTDHLKDYGAYLEAKGSTRLHVKKTLSLVAALCDGAGFTRMQDVDAAKAAEWLNQARSNSTPIALPDGESFTPGEVAKLLNVTRSAIGKNLRRRGLIATGAGKARRVPRSAVQELIMVRARGVGPEQCNHYIRAARGFTRWMTRTRRVGVDPIETLALVGTTTDIRHGRRELLADELQRLLTATRTSTTAFRGLDGVDRFTLYLTAAGTGFRASALANLTPHDFDLNNNILTLPARFNKSRKLKVQPLPADVASALRDYLKGKPTGKPVWPGTWRNKASDMLRIDLEAVGIPYVTEGPDGPEYADFHALRHTYLTMLGRHGVDLRTAQELAGHSTPLLTARYTHRRLHDLQGAVDKLPTMVPDTVMPISGVHADRVLDSGTPGSTRTGTDGAIVMKNAVPDAVPDAVTGDTRLHPFAQMHTSDVVSGTSDLATQPLEMKQPGASSHQVALSYTEWAVPGLNRGPSDFQSLARTDASRPKTPENKAISTSDRHITGGLVAIF